MKGSSLFASLLSLFIPGLGHMYKGEGNKGIMILFAAIVIANSDINILPLIYIAHPVLPPSLEDGSSIWSYWIPRITHDFSAVWSIAFWIWVIVDAYRCPSGKHDVS